MIRQLDGVYRLEHAVTATQKTILDALSLTMLKDCFKAVYGKPVHAFRREYKMQVATKLLTTTDMSITELAGEFGYENPNKFSTAFKEVIGVSPRAYRAKNK